MAILHRNRQVSALTPRYVQRFRCVGSVCEDSCCVGWPVHIDKKTYKAYRSQTDERFKPVVAIMQRVENPPNGGMYAVLPATGFEGRCPAHQDGMCAVQAAAGESYLSDTCQSYPRINRLVRGQHEQTMTLSCPEAARLALMYEDAFDFVETPVGVREGTVFMVPTGSETNAALLNEVRIFCMNLIRTRELALWQRLALLGTFCVILDKSLAEGKQQNVLGMIEDFVRGIENGALLAELESIQPCHKSQSMVFATLWASKGFSVHSSFQHQQMASIAVGLGGDKDGQVSGEALVAAYQRGLLRLDQALVGIPWLLEHYLLNEMFSHQFPISGSSAHDSFLRLIARFGLLRLLLSARCNSEDELPTPSMLVATVQLQARRFQHDPAFATQVNQSLCDSGWASLDRLYTLLRT
jgi:lysine-N-methylase